jgi:hypothetical protein
MIPTPKELKALARLCREQGILELKTPEIELKLSDSPHALPTRKRRSKGQPAASNELTNSAPESFDELTDEQKLFWSTQAMLDSSNTEGST